jgi:hypothetical protein
MVVAALILAFAALAGAVPASTDSDRSAPFRPYPFVLAPLITPNVAPDRILADTYVVLLKNDISEAQMALHINNVAENKFSDSLLADDGGLRHVYDAPGFRGYSGKFAQGTIDFLRSQPEVELIEKSQIFTTTETEHGAPWVSNHPRALPSHFTWSSRYESRVLHVSPTARSCLLALSAPISSTAMAARALMRMSRDHSCGCST